MKSNWFWVLNWFTSCLCGSVSQSCPTLCDPMDCSTPGFPILHVLHYLPESAQTHVHWVGDAIQPSHPHSFLDLHLITVITCSVNKVINYSRTNNWHIVLCCFLANCWDVSCYALNFSWCSRNNPFAYILMTVHLFLPRAFSMTECLPRPGGKLLCPFESRSPGYASLN